MAEPSGGNALIKYGPVGAPALGAALMILFIVVTLLVGDTDTPRGEIDNTVAKINSTLTNPKPTGKYSFKASGVDNAAGGIGVAPEGTLRGKIANERIAMDYPLAFGVVLQRLDDDFSKLDTDFSNSLSKDEYSNSGNKDFADRDVDKNGQLSREEFAADAPTSEFKKLDRNGDGKLSRDEYGKPDFDKKNEDGNDWLDEKEFKKVVDVVPTEFDLGPPGAVTAVADSKSFVITVTWEAATLAPAPDDVAYWIERYSPGDTKLREAKRSEEIRKFNAKAAEWEAKLKEWLNLPENKGKTKADFAGANPAPVRPPEVSDWERLNDTPCKDTKWEDRTFRTDFTYSYRVRTTTQAKLKADVKFDDKFVLEGFKSSLPTQQAHRPVVISNRVDIAWMAKSDPTVKVRLSKFHPVGGVWRIVEAWVTLNQGDEVGGKYRAEDLETAEFKAQLKVLNDDAKADAALLKALIAELKANREGIDFSTGWVFNVTIGSDFELSGKNGARFLLPKETKDKAEAPASDPTGMVNPLAVRVNSIDGKASPAKARFEITRWKEVGGRWYRIVVLHDVKKGETIGMDAAAIKKLGKDFKTVYNDGGVAVGDAEVTKLNLLDVSVETGLTFDGLEKRTVNLGGGKLVDLFGVFYVDK